MISININDNIAQAIVNLGRGDVIVTPVEAEYNHHHDSIVEPENKNSIIMLNTINGKDLRGDNINVNLDSNKNIQVHIIFEDIHSCDVLINAINIIKNKLICNSNPEEFKFDTYYPIGTILKYRNNYIKVINADDNDDPCKDCVFVNTCDKHKVRCMISEREDEKSVYFPKIDIKINNASSSTGGE